MSIFFTVKKQLLLSFTLFSLALTAQIPDSIKTSSEDLVKYPQLQIKGLFQARYLVGTSKDVDVNGLHHSDGSGTNNNFMLKYMRIQVRAQISKRTEVVALANLADFKNDPKSRVLENAYLKYTFNSKLALTVGQFRPWFGLEETYPIDIIKSLDWSNQYTEFGKLGWTSFQIGMSATGQTQLGTVPFQYAISIVNGNGKNQVNDNNDGKHYSTRLVFGLAKKYNFNVGLNGGVGDVFGKKIYAVGFDLSSLINFDSKWSLDMQLEGKQATNHPLYFAVAPELRPSNPDEYLIRGAYFLPNVRYEINHKNLSAFELSCRYEYLDTNFRLNSNPRQTITPMFGMEFLKNYGARIQLGMQFDRYKHQVENTSQYNNNLFIVQVQSRF
ncbi:OprO/OprP family phosphate-selective porin [Chryseobacterium sp. Ch-15]|uniref:Porin n=1 Tax=Chryseobacterium muglaense TaxID=2893752 RepID=A0A9Q3UPS1_9FLAO|nr:MULTISPECIES: porin [Chryseobacterium]MBD3906963.1 porin [Chryseobacterium muglaense]MBO6185837.1 porin [Chryseobacterium sp.]MCC9033193.1 OprO/OprP family phosphate-selective porin [Chryseobacterium muglaense]MCM2556131.1 OprO/OprP family phosphate-selective porin [Chryseobacterium muglaense]